MISAIASVVPEAPPLKVLTPSFSERLHIINDRERHLRNGLGHHILFSCIAGQMPSIYIQFAPGRMSRLLNQLTNRRQVEAGDGYVVSGELDGVTVQWVVPK